MKKLFLILLLIPSLVYGQGSGTPSTLRVKTDANGYLIVIGVAQTTPITSGTFSSRILKTDSNDNLQVILTGGPVSGVTTYADSTCAAPSIARTLGTTTGIAFTATPSIINCIAGVDVLTVNANNVTSTVPGLWPNGTAALPGLGFTTTTGFSSNSSTYIGISFTGTEAHQFQPNSQWIKSDTGGLFFGVAADLSLSRETAAILQMGVDAAGVTDQMFKGPDRITSDGVGGNLTIAGGRNRGASAGGSIIFQTSPAAGVGVTGTLATALTILSTGAVSVTDLLIAARQRIDATGIFFWNSRSVLSSPSDGKLNFANNSETVGIGLDFTTDSVLKIRDRAQTGAGSIGLGANLAISGTAPTAAGTGMAFTIGTGSTSFDWSITITTANAQSVFTLTLPTATNAWTCQAQSFTNPGSRKISMSARTTTTVDLTQYDQALGTVAVYVDGNVIVGTCTAH